MENETRQKLVRELIDDFGFTFPSPGTVPLQEVNFSSSKEEIDPFDTSFIDIEAIKSGKSLKQTELLHDLDFVEIDPFDTSHVETTFTEEFRVGESDNVSFKLDIYNL